MVGYAFEGYRNSDIEQDTVFTSRNVVFDKNRFYIVLIERANMHSSYNHYKLQTEDPLNDSLQHSANEDGDQNNPEIREK